MTTAIVRDRWQVTIPPGARPDWLEPGSILEWLRGDDGDQLIVKPYSGVKDKINWSRIWAGVKTCRSYKPSKKRELSASEFVALDRYRH